MLTKLRSWSHSPAQRAPGDGGLLLPILSPEDWGFSRTTALHCNSRWAILISKAHFIPNTVAIQSCHFSPPFYLSDFPDLTMPWAHYTSEILKQVPTHGWLWLPWKSRISSLPKSVGNLNLSPLCRCLAASDVFVRTRGKKKIFANVLFFWNQDSYIYTVTEQQLCTCGTGCLVFGCVRNQFTGKLAWMIYWPLWNRFQRRKSCRTVEQTLWCLLQGHLSLAHLRSEHSPDNSLPLVPPSSSSQMCISHTLPPTSKYILRPDEYTLTCLVRDF